MEHLLKLSSLTPDEIIHILDVADEYKRLHKAGTDPKDLQGKAVALMFGKHSTRTRTSLEVGIYQMGGLGTYLSAGDLQTARGEPVQDTARVLGRIYDGIEYRGYGQHIVHTLSEYSGVPVWNGLTNEFHPTQALADMLTMREHSQKPLSEMKLCFLGDAHNNVANSLMIASAKMGMDFRAISPAQCAPDPALVKTCRELAQASGARITVTDRIDGVRDCDFVYTDVWVSMGEPDDIWRDRIELLSPYQVNRAVMDATQNPEAKFLHCLPAFHNMETTVGKDIFGKFGISEMEVTEEVFESDASVVFDQAENRLHTIKAVMVATLGDQVY